MMKNLPGSYEKEIAKGHRPVWLFILLAGIFILASITFYFFVKPSKKLTVNGQKLSSSISSLENKYVGKSIKIDTTNIKAPWVLQNGSESSFILNSSTCKATISSSNNVPALLNAGQTLNSAVNNKLEEIKNNSKDQSLIIGETTSTKINSNKGQLEFLVKDSEYKAKDNTTHQTQVYGQWIGDQQLIITFDCNSNEWRDQQKYLDDFLDRVSVNIS